VETPGRPKNHRWGFPSCDERVSRIPKAAAQSALPTQTRFAVAATQREQVLAETELAHIVEGYDERSGRLVTFA
jgi:hypothetical protein